MAILFDIYDVQPNDTLTTIGERIGMTGDQVRDFHNSHCNLHGLVWFSSLIGIQKVVLHKNYKNTTDQLIALKENLPLFKDLPQFHSHNYNVKEKFLFSDQNHSEVTYDVYLNKEKKKDENVISIARRNFKIDNENIDNKISKIAIECSNSIEPIDIQLSQNGKVVDLLNHKELVQNFKHKLLKISDDFGGDINEKYLNKFEENISDKRFLLEQLSSTLLYQILFPNIGWFQNKSSSFENFIVSPNSFPLKFNCNFDYDLSEHSIAETIINGKLVDNYSLSEILKGVKYEDQTEEPAEVELELKYFTNKENKVLESAEGKILFMIEGHIFQEQKINIHKN